MPRGDRLDPALARGDPLSASQDPADALRLALATLLRGSRSVGFVDGNARVVGNGLRELDRFLNLLIEAAVQRLAPVGFDIAAFARRTNAAAKLGVLTDLLGDGGSDRRAERAWLTAIGAVRACFFHCGGVVHASALLRVRSALDRPWIAIGDGLIVSGAELKAIGAAYAAIGEWLVDQVDLIEPALDFTPLLGYVDKVAVACDAT